MKSFKLDKDVYVCVLTNGNRRQVVNPTDDLRFAKSFARSHNRIAEHTGWRCEVAKILGRVVDAVKTA